MHHLHLALYSQSLSMAQMIYFLDPRLVHLVVVPCPHAIASSQERPLAEIQ